MNKIIYYYIVSVWGIIIAKIIKQFLLFDGYNGCNLLI
jgi:hypothetical protein